MLKFTSNKALHAAGIAAKKREALFCKIYQWWIEAVFFVSKVKQVVILVNVVVIQYNYNV